MNQILIDGILSVAFVNGVLRIECGTLDREGKVAPSGMLMIPGPQAGTVLQSIANATRELEKRQREHSSKPGVAAEVPVEH